MSLTQTLGSHTFFGTLPIDFKTSFHALQQQSVVPACVVRPRTTTDVSLVLRTIAQYECHFAVRSGGHCTFGGSSNADGGITIDMKYFDQINVIDPGTVRIGTAQHWGAVYKALEPQGLVVVGGRDSSVGVGGFLLGGKLFQTSPSILLQTYLLRYDTTLIQA